MTRLTFLDISLSQAARRKAARIDSTPRAVLRALRRLRLLRYRTVWLTRG